MHAYTAWAGEYVCTHVGTHNQLLWEFAYSRKETGAANTSTVLLT